MSKLAHFLLNLADSSFLDFLTPQGVRNCFLKKNKRKKMSKLAIFLLNLVKIGLLDFWTPLVLEFDFFDENKRKKMSKFAHFCQNSPGRDFLHKEKERFMKRSK